MVPKKFLKWRKVFGKVESERMLTRKIWDHAIDLKEMFKPQKGRIYPLSKNEREEVQAFVEDQLRKGYIRPSKSSQMSLVFFIGKKDSSKSVTVVPWTSSHILYGLPLHQKGDVSKATC